MDTWKVLDSKTTYQDEWLKVRSDTCEMNNGRIIDPYHVLEYPNWVHIIAITDDNEIVLTRQYRHGIQAITTEIPAGRIEETDINPMAAILRELKEETGYSANNVIELGYTYVNPANQTNIVYSFLAIGVEKVANQDLDLNEEIEVVLQNFDEFLQDFFEGKNHLQALHATGLFLAVRYILSNQNPKFKKINISKSIFPTINELG